MSTPRSPSVVGALHAGIVAEEHEREQPHGVGESSGDADAADRVLHSEPHLIQVPEPASGITNEPNELLHLVLDRLERTRI
jgi:hypothetical protein